MFSDGCVAFIGVVRSLYDEHIYISPVVSIQTTFPRMNKQ
jgi:hypothetical protein